MFFKIDPPGTDYTRVSLDVPHGQLEDIVRAITTAAQKAGETPSGRAWEAKRSTARPAPRTPVLDGGETSIGDAPEGAPPKDSVWEQLTRALDEAPCCEWCGREVSFKDYRSTRSGVTVERRSTGEKKIACRRCWAERRDELVRVPGPAGRWSGAGDIVRGNPPAVVEADGAAKPAGVREHVGDELGHGGVVGPGVLHCVVGDHGEAGGAEQERGVLGLAVLELHVHEHAALRGGQVPHDAEQRDEVGSRFVVDLDGADAVGGCEVQAGDAGVGHGVSFGGCRCAGAEPAEGRDESERTEARRLREAVEEMLRAFVSSLSTSTDLLREDGPDCEGPEGGDAE